MENLSVGPETVILSRGEQPVRKSGRTRLPNKKYADTLGEGDDDDDNKVRGRPAKRPRKEEQEAETAEQQDGPVEDTNDMSTEESERKRTVLDQQLHLINRQMGNQTRFRQVLQRVEMFMDKVERELPPAPDMRFSGVSGARQVTMPNGETVYVVAEGDDGYL